MKNIIFYFTGTGNSYKVAQDIARKLDNCEVRLVTNFKEEKLEEGYERVGFVFPVYAMTIPKYFFGFLKKVDFSLNSDAYFFAVSTQGGNTGISLPVVNKLLSKQNIQLDGAFDIKMFSNYVVMYDMADSYDYEREKEELDIIVDSVVAKTTTKQLKKFNPVLNILTKFAVSTFAKKDKGFNVSNDCSGCGICEKVCPVRNISLVNNVPVFSHNCEQCVACIQICPSKSINYKDKTQTRKRYVNPEFSAKDLFVDGK